MKMNGHELSPAEFERLYKYFDRNNTGKINHQEFLHTLRGDLNENRKTQIRLAFETISGGKQSISFEDLKSYYNIETHPKFMTGEMNGTEILEEFTSQFDKFKTPGQVSSCEFEDYYKDVSAAVDRDDHFENLIQNNWTDPSGGKSFKKDVYKHFEIGADGRQKVSTGFHLKKI